VRTKNTIKTLLWVFFGTPLFFLGTPLFGQTSGPPPAMTGPSFEAGAGYAYISLAAPASQRVGLNGFNAFALSQLTSRWGGTVDFTYARAGDALGTLHADSIYTIMAGPVFYPFERKKTAIFIHALLGAAWVRGAVPITSTTFYAGWENRPAFALGAGVEHSLTGPFAARAGVDYLHTTFVNTTGATAGQNNLRLTATVVYRF
jgi:opacity protein-like surface antigen